MRKVTKRKMLCQFPRAVMAKCHKPGGLKQHKRILFQFWRLELWYQGGSRAMLFWNLERNPPLPLPSCMCLVGSFGIHCLQLYHSNLYLHCCFFFNLFIFIGGWLQYCSGFCHTVTWISHGWTCVPHPDNLCLHCY